MVVTIPGRTHVIGRICLVATANGRTRKTAPTSGLWRNVPAHGVDDGEVALD